MPEKGRETPEFNTVQKRARFAKRLSLKGLDLEKLPNEIVFIHGTSVQVLKDMIVTGVLHGQTGDTTLHKEGDIFVMADTGRIPDKRRPSPFLADAEAEALELASTYANINAEKDHVLNALGIPLSNTGLGEAAQHLLLGDEPATIEDHVVSEDMSTIEDMASEQGVSLPHLLEAARQRKGVFLGIRRGAVTHDMSLKGFGLGDPGEGDFKLMSGDEGLDISHVGGIHFLSERDKADFDEILRELNV